MDFEARDPIVPVLCETFSGVSYAGTSLAASGWTWVGKSSGRGRHSHTQQTTARKGIWLRPLCRDWRTQLGVPVPGVIRPPATQTGAGTGGRLDHDCLGCE